MGSGPRNYTESRIKHPPRPGGPSLSVSLISVIKVRPDLDKHGYVQVDIDPKTYDRVLYKLHTQQDGHELVDQYSAPKLCNPDTKAVFWFSQTGCHSTITMEGKHYVLMGVVRRREHNKSYDDDDAKSCTLKIKEASFTPEVKEWVDSVIADAMEGEVEDKKA